MASFENPYYPIVYVRGFSPTQQARESNFHDLYYGYAETSVEPRQKTPAEATNPSDRIALDLFESQLMRFIKEYDYVDATHGGLKLATTNTRFRRGDLNPTRSIWISRFYDADFINGQARTIDKHADDLWLLINQEIPNAFAEMGIGREGYKVNLIAHSMGGLVCRTLLQRTIPGAGVDPHNIINRVATIASPHSGINLGLVPDWFENYVTETFNPDSTSRFNPDVIKKFLGLGPADPVNSLGGKFDPKRCLCLIGSDYKAYDPLVQKIVGNHSDGLVKQENAFIQDAFTANVHRAHSGVRGIVNSYESYENIQRFLFGDTRVDISLSDIKIPGAATRDADDFYNFEFRLSVRNTGVFLHERREDPCENAVRRLKKDVATPLKLHTAFLSSDLAPTEFLHFLLSFRVVEHRVDKILLWSHEYPGRPIYSETLEVRLNGDALQEWRTAVAANPTGGILPPDNLLSYHWLSEEEPTATGPWPHSAAFIPTLGAFEIPLREAPSMSANLYLQALAW